MSEENLNPFSGVDMSKMPRLRHNLSDGGVGPLKLPTQEEMDPSPDKGGSVDSKSLEKYIQDAREKKEIDNGKI